MDVANMRLNSYAGDRSFFVSGDWAGARLRHALAPSSPARGAHLDAKLGKGGVHVDGLVLVEAGESVLDGGALGSVQQRVQLHGLQVRCARGR
jgi:hypothetical protein